jgi:tRNA(Phe) wybutosine-synthesizing methylase Tyw3
LREQNERIVAKKIINKINATSQRIIESNHITRKMQLVEEEIERLRKKVAKDGAVEGHMDG